MLLFFCVFIIIQVKKKNKELAEPDNTTLTQQTVTTGTESYTDIYETEEDVNLVFYNGNAYQSKDNIDTILVLGIDSEGPRQAVGDLNNNEQQADSLMLFVIDHDAQEYSILQIDRGTMARMTVLGSLGDFLRYEEAQICLAHTYGDGMLQSCRLTADAVSYLLQVTTIDHYMSLSMDCIEILNDQVGGVTVTIPADMTEVDPDWEEGAEITLQGDQAELFVRSRQSLSDDSNTFRMQRQRLFMQAWQEEAEERMAASDTFGLQLISVLSDYMVSDMTANELSELSTTLSEYTPREIYTLDGETTMGEQYVEFYPSEESIRTTILELYYDEYELPSEG